MVLTLLSLSFSPSLNLSNQQWLQYYFPRLWHDLNPFNDRHSGGGFLCSLKLDESIINAQVFRAPEASDMFFFFFGVDLKTRLLQTSTKTSLCLIKASRGPSSISRTSGYHKSSTDNVFQTSFSTLDWRDCVFLRVPSFSAAENKWSQEVISICNNLLCMAKKIIYLCVLFLNGARCFAEWTKS